MVIAPETRQFYSFNNNLKIHINKTLSDIFVQFYNLNQAHFALNFVQVFQHFCNVQRNLHAHGIYLYTNEFDPSSDQHQQCLLNYRVTQLYLTHYFKVYFHKLYQIKYEIYLSNRK